MSAAVRTVGITRRFGALTAVDRVDLEVPAGCVFGFLGRNGAGKTTLIRMLLGLVGPTSGSAELLGIRIHAGGGAAGPWDRVGYLVESPGLYPELSVADHLRLAGLHRGLTRAARDRAVDRMALGPYLRVPARQLSLGNRQRLGLALALVHEPELLVLDEPNNGMDPAGVVEVRELLRELARAGTTVFMSTHVVGELEVLADEVGIIHEGRLVEHLDRNALAQVGRPRLVVGMPDPGSLADAGALLAGLGWPTRRHPAGLALDAADPVGRPEVVAAALAGAGLPPRHLAVERDSLEAHFLEVTGGRP